MNQLLKPAQLIELKPYTGSRNGRIIAHFGIGDKGKPFYVDFTDKSHFLIAGINGSGKTTLLHAIICSLVQQYSSNEVQFFLLTGEKSGFTNYKNVPHVAGIAALQEEHILSCFEQICAEAERRKTANQSQQYNHLFIVADGFFKLSIPTKMKIQRKLPALISDAAYANVHLIFTAEEIRPLSPLSQTLKKFSHKVVFRSSGMTSNSLLGDDKAAAIDCAGEAYASLTTNQCLHFHAAKASVKDVVKPYNDAASQAARQQWASRQQLQNDQKQFDQLDPYQFEEYVAQRMRDCGYTKVQVTAKSGDYGADVLGIDPNGRKVCVQCKKYKGKVGFDAVQQINTARTLFGCERALLVTTSTVTEQARETAAKLKVELYEKLNAGSVIR